MGILFEFVKTIKTIQEIFERLQGRCITPLKIDFQRVAGTQTIPSMSLRAVR